MPRKLIIGLLLLGISTTCHADWKIGTRWFTAGTVDYTNDANCIFASCMESGAADDGPNNYTPSITGAAYDASGKYGGCYDFEIDSTQCYISYGDITEISGTAFTIVAWVKPESESGSNDTRVVIQNQGFPTYNFAMSVGVYATNADSKLTGEFRITTSRTAISTDEVGTGAWVHCAVVYNGTTMQTYINGTANGSPLSETTSLPSGSGNLNIGRAPQSDNYFDGMIDEVAVFSRALSEAEIQAIMNNGLKGDQ